MKNGGELEVKMSVVVDDEVWEKIAILAAKKRKKKQEIINEALREYLERHKSEIE